MCKMKIQARSPQFLITLGGHFDPQWHDHSGLWDVFWTDQELVIASDKVHLAEDVLAREVGCEVMYSMHRIPVILCYAVE